MMSSVVRLSTVISTLVVVGLIFSIMSYKFDVVKIQMHKIIVIILVA